MSRVIFKGCAVNRHLIGVVNRAAVCGGFIVAKQGVGNVKHRALDIGNCAAVAALNLIVLEVGIFKGYISGLIIRVNRRTVSNAISHSIAITVKSSVIFCAQSVFHADVANREFRLIDNLKHGAARTIARIIPHGADSKGYIIIFF